MIFFVSLWLLDYNKTKQCHPQLYKTNWRIFGVLQTRVSDPNKIPPVIFRDEIMRHRAPWLNRSEWFIELSANWCYIYYRCHSCAHVKFANFKGELKEQVNITHFMFWASSEARVFILVKWCPPTTTFSCLEQFCLYVSTFNMNQSWIYKTEPGTTFAWITMYACTTLQLQFQFNWASVPKTLWLLVPKKKSLKKTLLQYPPPGSGWHA